MSDRPLEPSDTERSEWPNATREYVEWLEEREDEAESLRQRVADLEVNTMQTRMLWLYRDLAREAETSGGPLWRHFADRARDILQNEEHQPDPDNWLTCQSDEMPSELAPAQIVEVFFGDNMPEKVRADMTLWRPGLHYRSALSAAGLKMVSREGLEPETRYVATDEDGSVFQFRKKPQLEKSDTGRNIWADMNDGGGEAIRTPDTHKIPGDWRDSLAAVWDGEG